MLWQFILNGHRQMKQLAQTRRPVLLQSYMAEEWDSALGSHFAKTKSTTNHVGDRTASKHNNTWVRILHCVLCPDMITLRAYVNRTILRNCIVAAARAQTVDTWPFFGFFFSGLGTRLDKKQPDDIFLLCYSKSAITCKMMNDLAITSKPAKPCSQANPLRNVNTKVVQAG